ncbi:hypothetical protein [Pedococcus sp. 2YAF34]|uniref:hypothetical protein n=1 Tax=Pedococcus sp. 2YAF34 TaxID=3233032 RepID=UPI003F9B1C28
MLEYRATPWLIEYAHHPELASELEDLGLVPAGCLVLDNGHDLSLEWSAAYEQDIQRYFLENAERPEPILVTPDGTVSAEVGDWYGGASLRVRTLLADGALVETKLRWPVFPPWPKRMQHGRRLTDLETEMTRHCARGRSIVVADGSPAQVLARHRDHVSEAERERTTVAVPLRSMDDVENIANAAFAHAQQVETAGLLLVGVLHVVGGLLAVAALLLGWLVGPWWLCLFAVPVVALAWWASVPVLVIARRWKRWRPPFPWVVQRRSRILTPGA